MKSRLLIARFGLVAAVLAALSVTNMASAAFILATTEDGNGADTHVANDGQQAQTTNHGGNAVNDIRVIQNSRARVGMLRFDLSSLGGPVSGVQLQLELTQSTRARTWNIYGLNDDGLTDLFTADNWGELAISFSNAPGFDQAASGVNTGNYVLDLADVTSLTTMNVLAGAGVNTSITSAAMDSFLNAAIANPNNKLVTLFISYNGGQTSTDSNPDWDIASKEHATAAAPTLIGVPEPASLVLALAAVAAAGVGLRRRC